MALLPFKTSKPQESLAEKVRAFRQQGLDDHAIIERLQKEGHTATEIFDALREADAQQPTWPEDTPPQETRGSDMLPQAEQTQAGQSSQNMPQNMTSMTPSMPPPLPPSQTTMSTHPQAPLPTPSFQTTPPQPPAAQQESINMDAIREQLDALAETIIEEKWKELRLLLDKIVEWKQKVEGRVLSLEREVNLLKEEVLTIQKSVLQRVEEYDQHIGDVMSEMKAMEKVFQKIIPSLTDNVSELRTIVEDLKAGKGKKKKTE